MNFEYKVVPAPTRGRRARGIKTPADRFALALEETINEVAAEGWEYLRTDTLPAEERQGLTGRTTVYQNMLVFRRAVASAERGTERTAAAPTPPEPPRAPRAPAAAAVDGQAPRPAPDPLSETTGDDRPETPQRAALKSLIEQELASARAPRLPSADAAQDLSTNASGATLPKLTASRKDMAAE